MLLPGVEDVSLVELTELVREVARVEILAHFGRTGARSKDDGSLLTDVDLAVQQRLIEALAEATPGIPVLGEEMTKRQREAVLTGSTSETEARSGRFWVLDPLDGTSNFACGFPAFSVSLALFQGGRAELGLIYDPVRDECFTGRRGQGARLNGQAIATGAPSERLEDAIALLDFKRIPPARVPHLLRKGAFRSQRNIGSVALDWCWLAAGRAQVYLHGGQRLWDYAAGRLIATEAGALVRLLEPGTGETAEEPSLEPRLALAAANASLFERWSAFVALPWTQ